jgi:16S rRNA processing protein RimM
VKNTADWLVVGRFGRPHGIKGFITIQSFTEPRDNILQYKKWHALINNQWLPLKIKHFEFNNKLILAQVEGYSEREQVASLTNIEIGIERSQLPELPSGEYYWHELVGMRVINQQQELLGSIKEIMPTGSNDVLVVVGEKRHLIPYLPDVVVSINASQREIIVDWDVDF